MFLYVISIENGQVKRVKIGISLDPFARLRSLQTGNPGKLSICHAVYSQGERMLRDMELGMHAELAQFRCPGGTEWFNTSVLKMIKKKGNTQKWRDINPWCAMFYDKRFRGTPQQVQSEIARRLNPDRLIAETG